jgi:hypothetical protein
MEQITVTVKLDKRTFKALNEFCRRRGYTKSGLISTLLTELLEEKEVGAAGSSMDDLLYKMGEDAPEGKFRRGSVDHDRILRKLESKR